MANPSLTNNNSSKLFLTEFNLNTAAIELLRNPANSNQIFDIKTLQINNENLVDSADVSMYIRRSSQDFYLARTIPVAKQSTLDIITGETAIYLNEGDSLYGFASANNILEISLAYRVYSTVSADHTRTISSLSAPTSAQLDTAFTITLITGNVPDGSTFSYSITGVTSADLNGASLSGNLTISSSSASISFTSAASADGKTMVFSIPSLSLSASISIVGALYSFSSFTFTNAGATGRLGPTLSNCLSSYNTSLYPWLNNTAYFNVVTQGYQLWTVPESGAYQITAIGAAGGGSYTSYGYGQPGQGARMVSTFNLTQGQKLKIVVGQQGTGTTTNSCGGDGGGGGGTFVSTESNTPLLVAGGGGGAGSNGFGREETLKHAPDSTNGNKGSGTTGGAGGTGGNGGSVQSGSCVNGGGGGGGFSGNGLTNGQSIAASSFINGATGGQGGNIGGFGGGGGAGTSYAGGGGGGYSGGGGGGLQTCSCSDMGNGGGGGCYSSTSYTYTANIGTGQGSVQITKAGPPVTATVSLSSTSVNEGSSVTVTVNSQNVSNGGILYWRINFLTGVLTGTDFSATSGTVTINSNTGSFTVTPLADAKTEGSETFNVEILKEPTTDSLAVSSTITIGDTSTGSAEQVLIATFFDGLCAYLDDYLTEYRNPSFYSYTLDGGTTFIGDGGGDMYDSGNYTYPWFIGGTPNNSILNGAGSGTLIDYGNSTSTVTIDTNFAYRSLGFIQPLVVLGYRTGGVSQVVGFQKSGNSGADGSGILASGFIYNGDTVNTFTVYAFIRQTYSAGDPSHCDLYMLIGHSAWGSVFGSISSYADPVSNGGNGGALYASSTTQQVIAVTMLLSKSSGVQVTNAECQTVVQNFTSRMRTYLGY